MFTSLKGRSAVVTGASSGIGKAMAVTFAREGCNVLAVARSEAKVKAVCDGIRKEGVTAEPFVGDVKSMADMRAMAEKAKELFGGVDILLSNAGIFPEKRLSEMTDEDYDNVMDTNVRGMFHAVWACQGMMKEKRRGRIILTSSITGPNTGFPGWAHYGASKAAQLGFMHTAAIELAPYGITDNEPMLAFTESWESSRYLIFPENPLITSGQLTRVELRKSGGASTVYEFHAESGKLLSMTETETAQEGASLSSSGDLRTAACEVTYTYGSGGELVKVFRDLPYELQENGNFGEYDLSYDAGGALASVYRGRHGGDIASSATVYLTRDSSGRITGTDLPLLTGTAQEMHNRTELRYDADGLFLQAVHTSDSYTSDFTCEYDGEGRLNRVSDSSYADFILYY